MLRYSLLFLALLLATGALAQKGKVRFFVNPGHSYRIKINQELMPKTNILELDVGSHEVSIWAPDYRSKDTTIQVIADTTITVVARLVHTDAYFKYQSELADYREFKALNRWPAVLLFASSATTAIFANQAMNRDYRDYVDYQFDARFGIPRQREILETEAALAHSRFRTNRAVFATSAGIAIGSIAYGIWGFKRSAKKELPTYKSANPWNLPDISLVPTLDGGLLIGLRYQF